MNCSPLGLRAGAQYNCGMRILLERSGGFAGITVRRRLDSDDLPASETRRLQSLLRKSRFFELPSRLVSAEAAPDRFEYRVTVETQGGTQTVEASDSAVPPELRPLLDWLMRRGI